MRPRDDSDIEVRHKFAVTSTVEVTVTFTVTLTVTNIVAEERFLGLLLLLLRLLERFLGLLLLSILPALSYNRETLLAFVPLQLHGGFR